MCNARRILLRRAARDESSARNSVSLQYVAKLQVCSHLKPWVCFRSLAGIPADSMSFVCQVEVSVPRTDHSPRGVLPSVVCMSVIVKLWKKKVILHLKLGDDPFLSHSFRSLFINHLSNGRYKILPAVSVAKLWSK